jgi:hypothetical protein
MKFKDILPHSIYRVQGQYGTLGYIRTGDTVTAVPTYGEPREGKRNTHLLLTINRYDIIHESVDGHRNREWDLVDADGNQRSDDDRWVDQVEVLRWVDNAKSSHGVVHGDEALDLTFQPVPFVTEIGDLTRSYNWDLSDLPVDSLPADIAQQVVAFDAAHDAWKAAYKAEAERTGENYPSDEWDEANPEPEHHPRGQLAEALEAEWGTKYFRYVETRRGYGLRRSTVDWGERVNLSKVDGPYTEADLAATRLAEKAQKAEDEARYAERSKVRRAAETKAKSFLVQTLAGVPDALVDQASNGLDRAVERARTTGVSDWSLDYVSYRDEVNTETPDGDSLVGIKASTLAAITYAWQQTFGDASWEDISAGVYERFHASDEVLHIAVDVPDTDDVEVTAERVAQYLPANYEVVTTETWKDGGQVLVKGTDVAGWTATDYVLPRLASGLLTATVYSLSRKAVTA